MLRCKIFGHKWGKTYYIHNEGGSNRTMTPCTRTRCHEWQIGTIND